MKQQVAITNYFKSTSLKSRPVVKMEERRRGKKNSLSLKQAPTKSPKTPKNMYEIDLTGNSSSSDSTIIITPENSTKINEESSLKRTPSFSSDSSKSKSPDYLTPSKRKYYSPTKKRNFTIKTPTKAKRNLNYSLLSNKSHLFLTKDFMEICEGLDDKTIFLLQIIYQFLHDDDLKHLLEDNSVNLLKKALFVIKPGMHLVCRLYWRKDSWQRMDSIDKILSNKKRNENFILHEVLSSLVENGFIAVSYNNGQKMDLEFDDLVKILKLDELKTVCKELNIKNVKTKGDIIQSLRVFRSQKMNITNYFQGGKSNNDTRLLKVLSAKVGICYKLSDQARNTLKELYMLMYLGINESTLREKGLELLLINDKAKIEMYPIDKNMELDNASVVFKNRDEFKSYVMARDIYEDFLEETNVSEKCSTVKNVFNLYNGIDEEKMKSYTIIPQWLHKYTPPYIYIKVLQNGIVDLKKIKSEENINIAVNILSTLIMQNVWRQHKKADWYAEKALILDRLMNKPEEAALVLLDGFRSNLEEVHKDVLRPRALLLAKRQKNSISNTLKEQLLEFANKEDILEKNIEARHFYKQPMESSTRGKKQFKIHTATGISVYEAEECCIQLYIDQGLYTHGQHWEGKIVTTIFFLLFWDIIYRKPTNVSGIFLSHYQMFPLDMFGKSFYINRQVLIEDRLKQIEEFTMEQLIDEIKFAFDSRPENELSPIRGIPWDAIYGVCTALGARNAALLCKRVAQYPVAGFPDLTMWDQCLKKIAFIEVKTDTDKPSLKQLQWMHYLKQHNIHTEFCYVGVNTSRQHSRNTGMESNLLLLNDSLII